MKKSERHEINDIEWIWDTDDGSLAIGIGSEEWVWLTTTVQDLRDIIRLCNTIIVARGARAEEVEE